MASNKLFGIDETKRLASKGTFGDQEAIKALGLEKLEKVNAPDIKLIDRHMVDRVTSCAAVAYVTGKKLGLKCLVESAQNLYQLVKFLEQDKLKTNEKPQMDKDDVLVKMGRLCKDTVEWCKTIGEAEDGRVIRSVKWYAEIISDVRLGDTESLKLLGLQKMPGLALKPIKQVPSAMSLQVDYKRAHLIASTATYMKNSTLRTVSQLIMVICSLIAKTYHPQLNELTAETDGQDVCETLNSELEELMSWIEFLEQNKKKATAKVYEEEEDTKDPTYCPKSSSEESEHESETESEGKGTKRQNKEPTEKDQEPRRRYITYLNPVVVTERALLKDYQTSASSYVCAQQLGLSALMKTSKIAMKYMAHVAKTEFDIDLSKKHQVNTLEREKEMETMREVKNELSGQKPGMAEQANESNSNGTKSPKRKIATEESKTSKKFKLTIKPAQRHEEEDSDTGEDEENEVDADSEKRSHHSKVKCRIPGCGVSVGDIRRHLKIHVDKEIEENDVSRAVAILTAGKSVRGPRQARGKKEAGTPGRFKKWCPVAGCSTITSYLNQHLVKAHKLKTTHVEYKVHLKSAKKYTGIHELDLLLKAKRPTQSAREAAEDQNEEGTHEEKEFEEKVEQEEESEENEEGDKEESDEEWQDDSTSKVKKVDYYSATEFTSSRHQWLCGFFKYLHTPSAGYKKLENRLQHVSQVENLLETLDPKGNDITILGEEFGDYVWNKWVHPHLSNQSKAPGTLCSYLTSLEKFFTFITSDWYLRKEMPPLHGNYFDIFKGTMNALKGWRATIDNETQDIQHRGHLKECDTLLTEHDITEIAKNCKKK